MESIAAIDAGEEVGRMHRREQLWHEKQMEKQKCQQGNDKWPGSSTICQPFDISEKYMSKKNEKRNS